MQHTVTHTVEHQEHHTEHTVGHRKQCVLQLRDLLLRRYQDLLALRAAPAFFSVPMQWRILADLQATLYERAVALDRETQSPTQPAEPVPAWVRDVDVLRDPEECIEAAERELVEYVKSVPTEDGVMEEEVKRLVEVINR